MDRPQKYFQTLTLLVMGPCNPIFNPQPSGQVFSRPSMTLTSKAQFLVSMDRPQNFFETGGHLVPQPCGQLLFRPNMTWTSKSKLLVSMDRPQKYFQTLTILVMGAIQPYFISLAIWTSTFQAQYDLDLTLFYTFFAFYAIKLAENIALASIDQFV